MSAEQMRARMDALAVRGRGCGLCGARPGVSCTGRGDHLARWLDAYRARVISRGALVAVVVRLTVVTKWCVVPGDSAGRAA